MLWGPVAGLLLWMRCEDRTSLMYVRLILRVVDCFTCMTVQWELFYYHSCSSMSFFSFRRWSVLVYFFFPLHSLESQFCLHLPIVECALIRLALDVSLMVDTFTYRGTRCSPPSFNSYIADMVQCNCLLHVHTRGQIPPGLRQKCSGKKWYLRTLSLTIKHEPWCWT